MYFIDEIRETVDFHVDAAQQFSKPDPAGDAGDQSDQNDQQDKFGVMHADIRLL